MKKQHGILLGGLVAALIGLVAAVALSGVVTPWDRDHNYARPPCDQLEDRQTVADAFATNQALVSKLETVGPGVTVSVDTPCDDPPNRALVKITYTSDAEWDGIGNILGQEGFGVAVDVVKT